MSWNFVLAKELELMILTKKSNMTEEKKTQRKQNDPKGTSYKQAAGFI